MLLSSSGVYPVSFRMGTNLSSDKTLVSSLSKGKEVKAANCFY